jgi:hypothetical protein
MTDKTKSSTTEEFKVSGEAIINKIKELIKEGNIRKITLKSKDGKEIAEFPLTVGVIGTALLPVFAAIGTIIALAAECTISVEREINVESEYEETADKEDEEEDDDEE